MRASSLLLCVAAACLLAPALAGSATGGSYPNDQCSGTPTETDTLTTGTCDTNVYSSTSSKTFCLSQYQALSVQYSDNACTAGKETQANLVPLTCGYPGYREQYECKTLDVAPLDFNGLSEAGWEVSLNCKNVSTQYGGSPFYGECSEVASSIKCSYSARKFACEPSTDTYNNVGSRLRGCTGNIRGSMYFSDAACKNFVYASGSPSTCRQGSMTASCPNNLPEPPSEGVISFYSATGSSACDASSTSYAPSMSWYKENGCYNNRKFKCIRNETGVFGELSSYMDGACSSTAYNVISAKEGVCVSGGQYSGSNYKFFCSAEQMKLSAGLPSSAAAVSVSFVAVAAAAFLALIGARA